MNIEYRKTYSQELMQDMEYKIYGHGGTPCIYFPCQDGRFYDFENFGMLDVCRQYLEDGKLQVFTPDTVDAQSLSADWLAGCARIRRQESYYQYITLELVPQIYAVNPLARERGIILIGFSLGAYHSANFYFRRPDIFCGNLSLSGVYSISYLIHNYSSDETYLNSPVDSLRGLPAEHYYRYYFEKNKAIFCTGQGAWEHPMVESTRELEEVMKGNNIPGEFHYWGYDVSHDWYWWKKQFELYLPELLFS